MKFQNPSLNFFERTDGRTHGQTETNMLPTFFFGTIKTGFLAMHLSCIENISLIASVEKSTKNVDGWTMNA